MIPSDLFARIPSPTAFVIFSSLIIPTFSHALPRQTKALPHRTLDILPWPLVTPVPTAAASGLHAVDSDNLLLYPRQELNTVCGYIGGDPDLPATCSAGSYCAVVKDHGAIGCCPEGGPCTDGVFTGCVDGNSDPQTEIDPYVFTCQGGDTCYKNRFDGGFFQYGCGSKTGMEATVKATAKGKSSLDLTQLSIALTASKTSLSEPTTLGTKTKSKSKSTSKSKSKTTSKSKSETKESSKTEDPTTTTESESTSTAEPTDDVELADAPNDNNDNSSSKTGAIVGGTIGGVAFLALLVALGLYFWRRRKGNVRHGPGKASDPQYIRPMSDTHNPFAPLPSVQEVDESELPQGLPPSHCPGDVSSESHHHGNDSPPNAAAVSSYNSSSASSRGGLRTAVGGSGPYETDAAPLTRELPQQLYTEEYSSSYGRPSDDSQQSGNSNARDHYGDYPGPRRGGGGSALWQQNRMQTRNLTWL